MTVLEAVRNYKLGDFNKTYMDVHGNTHDLVNLKILQLLKVKSISFNLITKECTITVINIENF